MAITMTISLTNWRDVESGTTGNPMAEASILAMARAKEHLVEDEGHMFAPVEQQGRWSLDEVLTERGIAESLRIPFHEAHRLLLEAQVPVFENGCFRRSNCGELQTSKRAWRPTPPRRVCSRAKPRSNLD